MESSNSDGNVGSPPLFVDELVKPLFSNGMYDNPWTDTWVERGLVDIFKLFRTGGFRPSNPMTQTELDQKIPIVSPDLDALNNPPSDSIQVTWIGHATALVQMEGVSFLTDPIWSSRASPVQFAGPKRYRDPPLKLEELPPISFIVISHDHYDHLDYNTVMHFGNKTKWFVPVGVKSWFASQGITNVEELSWWDTARFNENIQVGCTPCQHWSKRSAIGKKKTLWSSWVILGKEKRVFFSGDTGYCSVFKTIGKQYGPFDLSLIAIGAYCPRDFMRPQHVDPYEAVAMHQELRSKQSLGIHWGTFALTREPEDEPPKLLAKALQDKGLQPTEFIVSRIGESLVIPSIGRTNGLIDIVENL